MVYEKRKKFVLVSQLWMHCLYKHDYVMYGHAVHVLGTISSEKRKEENMMIHGCISRIS